MANHAVRNQRIRAIKETVTKVKPARFSSGFGWKLFIFLAEFWKSLSQQIELDRAIHVDTHEFARPIPERFRQGLCIGDRLIEVHRRHVKTMALAHPKELEKVCAVQTGRNDGRDEPGEFRHVDVSAQRFVCKVAQNQRGGIEGTPNLHRVNGPLGLTGCVKAKVIYYRIRYPRDFHLPGWFPAEQLFLATRG